MITDFVVANTEEALAVLATQLPSSRWQVLSGWKGLDPVKLRTLATVAAATLGRTPPKLKLPLLGGDQRSGPLVLEVGVDFRDLIASLNPADFDQVADRWLSTDELRADNWSKQDATAFVRDISKLARAAHSADRNLLLWMAW